MLLQRWNYHKHFGWNQHKNQSFPAGRTFYFPFPHKIMTSRWWSAADCPGRPVVQGEPHAVLITLVRCTVSQLVRVESNKTASAPLCPVLVAATGCNARKTASRQVISNISFSRTRRRTFTRDAIRCRCAMMGRPRTDGHAWAMRAREVCCQCFLSFSIPLRFRATTIDAQQRRRRCAHLWWILPCLFWL